MRKLETGKPKQFETAIMNRGRTIVVEVGPRFVTLWRKGTRQRVSTTYDELIERLLMAEARDNTGFDTRPAKRRGR